MLDVLGVPCGALLAGHLQHLRELAPKYVATKFVSINSEKTPFFVTKLAVRLR